MFRCIIAGSRHFTDYDLLASRCDFFLSNVSEPIEIVSGTAKGADLLGERYAKERGYKITRFPADWNQFGKSAGPRRNKQMAEYANALIAFPLKNSNGTRHMIKVARENSLAVRYGLNPNKL